MMPLTAESCSLRRAFNSSLDVTLMPAKRRKAKRVDFLATDQYEDLVKVLHDSQLQPFHQVSTRAARKRLEEGLESARVYCCR